LGRRNEKLSQISLYKAKFLIGIWFCGRAALMLQHHSTLQSRKASYSSSRKLSDERALSHSATCQLSKFIQFSDTNLHSHNQLCNVPSAELLLLLPLLLSLMLANVI